MNRQSQTSRQSPDDISCKQNTPSTSSFRQLMSELRRWTFCSWHKSSSIPRPLSWADIPRGTACVGCFRWGKGGFFFVFLLQTSPRTSRKPVSNRCKVLLVQRLFNNQESRPCHSPGKENKTRGTFFRKQQPPLRLHECRDYTWRKLSLFERAACEAPLQIKNFV